MKLIEKSKIAAKFAANLSGNTLFILVDNSGECLQVESVNGLEQMDVFQVAKNGNPSNPSVKLLN